MEMPQCCCLRFPNIGLSMGPVSRVIEVLRRRELPHHRQSYTLSLVDPSAKATCSAARNNKIVLEEDVNDQGSFLCWACYLHVAQSESCEAGGTCQAPCGWSSCDMRSS